MAIESERGACDANRCNNVTPWYPTAINLDEYAGWSFCDHRSAAVTEGNAVSAIWSPSGSFAKSSAIVRFRSCCPPWLMLFQETDYKRTCRRVAYGGREALTFNGDPGFFFNAIGGANCS